jgi:NAD-dependent dihydropyrimidine dehydrogenase PreA subunit
VIEEPAKRRWYPVIDYSRCTNCMECIDFCLFGVYGVDQLDRILVEEQDNCKKGCPACSRVCPENAIIFPQHKDSAIAGADGEVGNLKIDLSKLFGATDISPLDLAVAERDAELVADGRDAVGMSVGIPKHNTRPGRRRRTRRPDEWTLDDSGSLKSQERRVQSPKPEIGEPSRVSGRVLSATKDLDSTTARKAKSLLILPSRKVLRNRQVRLARRAQRGRALGRGIVHVGPVHGDGGDGLEMVQRDGGGDFSKEIAAGIKWLAEHQNPDGGWGDTTKSLSNISTTMLCRAVFHATGTEAQYHLSSAKRSLDRTAGRRARGHRPLWQRQNLFDSHSHALRLGGFGGLERRAAPAF